MTIPIPQPEYGVEIEAEEKKIPANENKLTLVPETNSFGQNFRPSEGSKNSIEVSSCCGCPHPCKCNPCHCEGFAIDSNPVTLVASVAPPVLMMGPRRSSKQREAILPKLVMTVDECQPCQCGAIMDPAASLMT